MATSNNTNADRKIILESTGKSAPPDPWKGPQVSIESNGDVSVSSLTLPSAASIFFPVFVISEAVSLDMINYLLDSSRPAIDRLLRTALQDGQDPEGQFDPRFVLPPERDPKYLLSPSSPPLVEKDLRLPFLNWSLERVFAAWMGKDEDSMRRGVAPLRMAGGDPDKPRHWTRRTFLVLDDESIGSGSEPTAQLAYLDPMSNDQQDLEFLRCDLPVSLRLMVLLESGMRNVTYVKKNLLDQDGVVRYERYEEWFEPDGMADREGQST